MAPTGSGKPLHDMLKRVLMKLPPLARYPITIGAFLLFPLALLGTLTATGSNLPIAGWIAGATAVCILPSVLGLIMTISMIVTDVNTPPHSARSGEGQPSRGRGKQSRKLKRTTPRRR